MNVSIIKNWLRCRYGKKFREDDIRFMIRDRYGILMNIGKVPENDFGCAIKLPVKEKTAVKFYRKGEKYSRDRDAEGFDYVGIMVSGGFTPEKIVSAAKELVGR